MTRRETVDVGGVPISYLTAGEGGPLVLLFGWMNFTACASRSEVTASGLSQR